MTRGMKSSVPPWQRRRAELLHETCRFIIDRRDGGATLKSAVFQAVRKYRRRALGKGKRLRLSAPSCYRWFYRWRKRPRPETFYLRFNTGSRLRFPAYVRFLLTHHAGAEGLSMPALYRRLKAVDPDLPFSVYKLGRDLPAGEIRAAYNAAKTVKRASQALSTAADHILSEFTKNARREKASESPQKRRKRRKGGRNACERGIVVLQ